MSTKKALGGSLGAILVLIISQIAAKLLGDILVITRIPAGLCNIIAGAFYFGFTYVLLKLFAEKLLKMNIKNIGIPHFYISIKWIVVAIFLPVTVLGTYLLLPGKFVSSGMNATKIFLTLSAGIAFTGIAAGFVEEMVFRGFMLNLLKTKWNTWIAVIVPSVSFGAVHLIGMKFSVLSCLLVLIAGTLVGIMFSLIALEKNSMWNSGIVHALWNIIIIGGGMAVGASIDKYSLMTYVLDTKSFVITGGEFGIESSIISVTGYLLVIIFAIYMIERKKKV